jgi:hypothetical protein
MGCFYQFDQKILRAIGKIRLNPDEIKYIASCDCIDPASPLAAGKAEFERLAMAGESIEVSAERLGPFPQLVKHVILPGNSIKEYFELGNHNEIICGNFREYVKNLKVREVLKGELLRHANACSVELAELKGGAAKVWSISGVRHQQIDFKYIDIGEGYVTTHGETENGRIAIRQLDKKRDKNIITQLKKLPDIWTSKT